MHHKYINNSNKCVKANNFYQIYDTTDIVVVSWTVEEYDGWSITSSTVELSGGGEGSGSSLSRETWDTFFLVLGHDHQSNDEDMYYHKHHRYVDHDQMG